MSTSDRLKFVMDKFGIKGIKALAERVGINRNTLQSAYERKKLSADICKKISHEFGLNSDWLASGIGEMARDASQNAPELINAPDDRYAYLAKVRARLSAGGGIIPDERIEDFPYIFQMSWLHRVASSPNNCILMEISGDSMSPILESGDLALIDKGRIELGQSGIYAFGEHDFLNVKELVREGRLIRVRSLNNDGRYPDRLVDSDEIRIIGKLIWLGRELK